MTAKTVAALKADFQEQDPQEWMDDLLDTYSASGALAIHSLTAATVDIATDLIAISDESEAGDPTRGEAIADVLAAAAGNGLAQNSTSKALEVNVHGLPAAVVDITTDLIAISDESVAGDPTRGEAIADVIAAMVGTGLAQNAATKVLELASAAKAFSIPLNTLVKQAAWKDPLGDAPDATALGLADAAGSVLTGTTTNGGATASASEVAAFTFNLPDNYVAGEAVTVRVRAKVSVARQVSQTVDVVAKLVGDTLGADICATAAQSLTTDYANYDFTITPATLTPGGVLWIEVYLATNDTGAAQNGLPTAAAISVRPVCYS